MVIGLAASLLYGCWIHPSGVWLLVLNDLNVTLYDSSTELYCVTITILMFINIIGPFIRQ